MYIEETNPVISVILPVYNAEAFLEEAINSILGQSFSNFELIIVNDGSSDKTSEIINRFADIDKRVILIERENKGLVFSLNQAILIAKGKYLARMDGDDISTSQRFEKQIEMLESTNADICGSHYIAIMESGKKIIPILCPLNQDSVTVHLGASANPFAHGSVMIRKSFLLNNKLMYNTDSLAEDYNLWIDCCKNNAVFANVDEFLFYYRVYSGSITGKNTKRLRKAGKDLGRNFTKTEKVKCMESSIKLISQDLTEYEEVFLLITTYRLALKFEIRLFLSALRKISLKSKIVGMLKILSLRA